jgi:hypothetical protein
MFNKDFYPTPEDVIKKMMEGQNIEGLVFLEPSAGKGNIVDYLIDNGAKSVIACESDENLQKILETKCKVISHDFLTLTSEQVSHIDAVIMNPPFSADEAHILHAYQIAPPACKIIALCNWATIENPHTQARKQLAQLISNFGTAENLGDCFTDAERKTGIHVGLIILQKSGQKSTEEFNGFFMEEEPEYNGGEGLMPYNIVRDIVNRYIKACQVYKEVLSVKSRLNSITGKFFNSELGIKTSLTYEDYKKELQKSGWYYIINEMDLSKYTTRGVKEDINKFVEQQIQIPFTMKNIYQMLDIIRQTAGQRMDKAILEAFDRVTERHHDNRHHVKGWKTNSHFLVGKKFILPNQINPAKEYGYTSNTYRYLRNSHDGTMPDFEKALCFLEGIEYNTIKTISQSVNDNTYGEWYESHFFKYKGYKNGNMHFEFISDEVWGRFNQRVARIKGYPLPEYKEQTSYQKRQTGRKDPTEKANSVQNVLFTFKS